MLQAGALFFACKIGKIPEFSKASFLFKFNLQNRAQACNMGRLTSRPPRIRPVYSIDFPFRNEQNCAQIDNVSTFSTKGWPVTWGGLLLDPREIVPFILSIFALGMNKTAHK